MSCHTGVEAHGRVPHTQVCTSYMGAHLIGMHLNYPIRNEFHTISGGHSWRSLAEMVTSFPTKICMVEHVSNPNITNYCTIVITI